ncbi:MAG: hypothetical protein IBJ15_07765 [Alphaproteobacteria bacterium]|nr:hypothetical protein [Alphaproteobacteria bacterium]
MLFSPSRKKHLRIVHAAAETGEGNGDRAGRALPPDYDALHPWFAAIRDYLASIAGPGRIASRADFDPCWLRGNLRLVNLVEVVRGANGAARFRFRLVGTTQTELARREITGLFVEDAVLPVYVDRILVNMRTVVRTRAAVYDRFPMPHPGREFIDSERVYFPLASDGRNVDMILVACSYPNDLKLKSVYPYEELLQSSSSAGMR